MSEWRSEVTIEVDNRGPTVMRWSKMRHFQTENSVFCKNFERYFLTVLLSVITLC